MRTLQKGHRDQLLELEAGKRGEFSGSAAEEDQGAPGEEGWLCVEGEEGWLCVEGEEGWLCVEGEEGWLCVEG